MSEVWHDITALGDSEERVLAVDMETQQVRVISRAQMDREMNSPSDEPRVVKIVLSDGISTKDGCA